MTGILPIKKYGEHSAINVFDEYSMISPADLSGYFGFTEEEVRELCRQNGADFPEFQKWYDSYVLNGLHIYNPKSVVDAIKWGTFESYWTGTETYEALKIYIDLNFDGLKEAAISMLGNVLKAFFFHRTSFTAPIPFLFCCDCDMGKGLAPCEHSHFTSPLYRLTVYGSDRINPLHRLPLYHQYYYQYSR